MSYLISLFPDHGPFFVRDNKNGTWDEIYNPEFATSFNTQKLARDWMNTHTSFAQYSQVVSQVEAVENWRERMTNGWVRRTTEYTDNNHSRPYNGESPEEILDWWWDQQGPFRNNVRYEDYKTWPHLYSKFKHLWSVEAYIVKGQDTLPRSVKVYTSSIGNYEQFRKEIMLVIDRIEMVDEDGWKMLPIFDHYLSNHGNSAVLLNKGKQWRVKTRSHDSVKGTLKECFEYMKDYRYYDNDDDCSDGDDE